jgi:site-specific recombinase XerD
VTLVDLAPSGGGAVPATVAQLVEITDAWLGNRRLSELTKQAYRRDVLGWLGWCENNDHDPLAVAFTMVNAYARELEATLNPRTGRQFTAATVARKLSAVSSWYAFLVALGAIARNPVVGADRPGVDRDHSSTVGLAEREAAALVAAADLDPYPGAVRTRALIRFLLDLGARVSDATRTQLRDLGTVDGYRAVRLHMKGGKIRWRRLPEQLATAIDVMLAGRAATVGVRVDQLDPAAPLFATASGRPVDRREVYQLVRRLARCAGLTSWARLSPHSLRHAFATIARARGAALEDVQDAMGHADPRTTRRYDRDRYSLERDPSTLVAYATAPARATAAATTSAPEAPAAAS